MQQNEISLFIADNEFIPPTLSLSVINQSIKLFNVAYKQRTATSMTTKRNSLQSAQLKDETWIGQTKYGKCILVVA